MYHLNSFVFASFFDCGRVENVADDDVEPKPAIIEASGDVKPTVNVKLKVKIPFQARIAHIEEKPKPVPTTGAKPYLAMQCERSGEYKPPKMRKKPNLEGTLRGFFEKDINDWWITMLCGIHSHELAPKLADHLLAGRIKEEEKKRVIDMTKSLAVLSNILTDLKEKNKESVTTIKQVNNAKLDGTKEG
ncbi:hypothetical protein MTR_7g034570 [Medicago truncatula]|uniref:FAR1 DNA-binding domain protein n=1 Tax=Medicago truncatula TaxID=3880 RepID=A0A072TXR1_MEDTR|nr:hypothetical protein MTR_7g034570 [Medicago truncatula]